MGSMAADGVLFRASFEHWPMADVAVGGRMPLKRAGNPVLGPGRHGNGLVLDGGSYLEFPAGENVGSRAGTVSLWVRPDAWGEKTYDSIFGFSDNNVNAFHLERSHPRGLLRLVVGGPDTADGAKTRSLFSSVPLQSGVWVHVAAAWDTDTGVVELFIDGTPDSRLEQLTSLPEAPSVLVGCGFGRLARALTGTIDEVVILDHAASAEEIRGLMEEPRIVRTDTGLANDGLCAMVDMDSGSVIVGDAGEHGGGCIVGPAVPSASVDGRNVTWPRFAASVEAAPRAAGLGDATHRVFVSGPVEGGIQLRYHVQVQKELPLALLWVELANTGDTRAVVSSITVMSTPRPGSVLIDALPADLRIFLDSGGLTGSGVRELGQPSVRHTARGAAVIHDLSRPRAASFSFVSFLAAGVSTSLSTDAGGAASALQATCDYPGGWVVSPRASVTSEVFAIGFYADGHTALTQWADAVMAVGDLRPPRFRPSGYNSWYAYRLEVSEEIVLENARIMRERWGALGLDVLQIDHGWQYRDVVGNWVANERFPHGLPWLSTQLGDLGFRLGLWLSVANISEHAPFFAKHPEALMHHANGNPVVSAEHWFWKPHGRTFSLDPTHRVGAAFYEETGQALRSYGCVYAKNDFQSNLLRPDVVVHDREMVRGVPVYRRGMDLLRKGMGPDMAYHACNGALNVIAGTCDVAWTHRDIGNPSGDWKSLRLFVNELCCRHHVSGKFYWSDPDYLQVGQGSPNEKQVRMAICALGGGPTFICDRLPELDEQALALIPKCLPGYGKVARPLDLFTHLGYPQVWDLPVETGWGSWHVVGFFNLEERPQRIDLDLQEIGVTAGSSYAIYDFFGERSLGTCSAADGLGVVLRVPVPAMHVRVLRIAPVQRRPFVVGTDLHLTQGGVELRAVAWDEDALLLSGVAVRSPGLSGHVVIHVPEGFTPADATVSMQERTVRVPVRFEDVEEPWSLRFEEAK